MDISSTPAELSSKSLDKISYEILPTHGGASQPKSNVTFKLIIIGYSGVGKSCLMRRVTCNEFSEDHEVTIGVEFGTMLFKMDQSIFKL